MRWIFGCFISLLPEPVFPPTVPRLFSAVELGAEMPGILFLSRLLACELYAWHCNRFPLLSRIMATEDLFAQVVRLPAEERRFLAEIIWETVDADLPAQWEDDSTLAAEVERRFEAFKAGRERGLTHEEVFAAAKVLVA